MGISVFKIRWFKKETAFSGGSVKKFVSLEENDSFLVRITI
ncbi:hypothetical protein CLOM621_08058 [Clostridium sp. M62/1]|nr:hypothetical protein CLOM621_08058 [Clostridium sp. M62/1]